MKLGAQLEHLDKALLSNVSTQFPDVFTEAERAQISAYLVLSHAVLEEYLEATFERHFERLSAWLRADMVPLECMRFAYAVSEYVPDGARVPYRSRNTAEVVRNGGRREFLRKVGENHGLKARNVESLARLVGLQWVDLEGALNSELADLDTLGVNRGAASHLSPFTEKVTAISVTDSLDDVRGWVDGGRKAVEALSDYLERLLRGQQPNTLIVDWDGN